MAGDGVVFCILFLAGLAIAGWLFLIATLMRANRLARSRDQWMKHAQDWKTHADRWEQIVSGTLPVRKVEKGGDAE